MTDLKTVAIIIDNLLNPDVANRNTKFLLVTYTDMNIENLDMTPVTMHSNMTHKELLQLLSILSAFKQHKDRDMNGGTRDGKEIITGDTVESDEPPQTPPDNSEGSEK